MSKATYIFVTFALLVLAGAARAAPVSVQLQAHNQRSSSGTLSTLKWKACAPVAVGNPCLSTSVSSTGGIWSNANATPSNAVWTWDAATGVLSMTGIFQSTSFISSNANGSPIVSDKSVDLAINAYNNTITASSYRCVEGTFLVSVGANGCLNTTTGGDFVDDSSALYNVGGNALCIQRTIGGDDTSTGTPRGLTAVAAAPPCDAAHGAFELWWVEQDDTATGGQLIVRNGIPITDAGTNYLTFAKVPEAVDDGPFIALPGVPLSLDVLANDNNFTDPVTVTVTAAPTKGTAIVTGTLPGAQAGIRIQYTASAGAAGADSFQYTVLNGDGMIVDTATVSTVNALAFAANDDTASTSLNSGAIPINVGANDVGFSDPVTVVITSTPNQGGTVTPPGTGLAANAIVSYTPATMAPGTPTYTEAFTYQITDADSNVDTAAVTVTVTGTGSGGVLLQLDAHNQRSSSGVLSTLKWKACSPLVANNPCLSTSASSTGGIWSNANATPSNAVWTWDAATGVLSMTGIFQSTVFISSNANGSPVISDRVVDLVINTVNKTTTAASYRCVEGTFIASVGANGCLNIGLGDDFANNSSALYDVGGNAGCVQRTLGGDDVSIGNPRGVTTVAAAPPCDTQDGAFDLWEIELDNTASGGQLIIRNATPITNAGANFLTFSVAPDSVPDPFTFGTQAGVPVSTLVTSGAVTVSGIVAPAPVSVAAGQYSLDCSASYTSTASTINNGQTVCVRHTSAALPATSTVTTLTIGGVSGTFTSTTALSDTDGDGVLNNLDNCTQVSNPNQCDSDGDGYGNHCDGDLTGNGVTNSQDDVVLRTKLGTASSAPTYNVGDLNCNGFVNAQDTVLFRQLLGKSPGPSGLHP